MARKFLIMFFAMFAVTFAQPVLEIGSTTFDGGDVAANSKVHATFTIRNTGTSPLEITSLRAPCGCTVAQYDRVIRPGRTGTVNPVVDVTGMSAGIMSRSVHITTNAPNAETLTFIITANVLPPPPRSWQQQR